LTYKWSCQDGNLAGLDAGSISLTVGGSKVSMTSDSVVSEGYDIPAAFDAGKTWSEKVTVNGSVESNGKKVGTSLLVATLDCTDTGTGSITVPAGKFDTVKFT